MIPEPPQFNELDFSEFHPLDHSVRECWGYPGGRRRHLRLRWDHQIRPKVKAVTVCRVGMHELGDAWANGEYVGKRCVNCWTYL